MRQLLIVFTIACIALAGHNMRHHKQSIGNSQKSLVQTREVEYIDDDVTYTEQPEISQESQQAQETLAQQPADQVEQQSDELLTNSESDQLDLEEQQKYEEQRRQQLAQTVGSDNDSYMNNLDVKVQEQDPTEQMPVDVVENQLNPIIQKDPIPDQKGMDSPFSPADGTLLMNPEEPEYEIKENHLMPDEIYADQLGEVLEKIEKQEEQENAILAAQGPQSK